MGPFKVAGQAGWTQLSWHGEWDPEVYIFKREELPWVPRVPLHDFHPSLAEGLDNRVPDVIPALWEPKIEFKPLSMSGKHSGRATSTDDSTRLFCP